LLSVLASNSSCLLAMGSRVKRLGSVIDRHLWRHVTGLIFATFASVISGLPVYDSQCGVKLFRRDVVATAFREPFATQWLFDVEILVRLRDRLGMSAVLEMVAGVPLKTWVDVKGSKLRLKHLLGVPSDLLKTHVRYNAKRADLSTRHHTKRPEVISSRMEERVTAGVS
jgi:hypothetical protein